MLKVLIMVYSFIYQVFKVDLAQKFGHVLVKSVDSLCPSFAVVNREPRHSFLGCIRVLCTLHWLSRDEIAVATHKSLDHTIGPSLAVIRERCLTEKKVFSHQIKAVRVTGVRVPHFSIMVELAQQAERPDSQTMA